MITKVNYIVLYVMGLPYVGVAIADMSRTELGVEVELCGLFWLSYCDASQGVKLVEDIDTLFFDK